MFIKKAEVDALRERYKEGVVVVLDWMDDPHAPPVGTKGVVEFVDDAGQIHVRWGNGSGLALVPNVDEFHLG